MDHPSPRFPVSPRLSLDGIIYFPRLCDKVRLHHSGQLPAEYHANLGSGMDLWTCQFLGIDYQDLAAIIRDGADDSTALTWAREFGTPRSTQELAWWTAFMKTRGFRDELAERLSQRKAESGFSHRDEIQTFMDYIDADEQRA